MRLFSPTLAIGLLLCLHTTQGYYFSEGESNFKTDDLATLESTPGVSIVYPRAVGPETALNIEVEGKDELESAPATTTPAPTTTTLSSEGSVLESTTTTVATPTTTQAETSTTTESTSTVPGMELPLF